jgi:hypothetical protein
MEPVSKLEVDQVVLQTFFDFGVPQTRYRALRFRVAIFGKSRSYFIWTFGLHNHIFDITTVRDAYI